MNEPLCHILQHHYGLDIRDITRTQGGWSADAYVVVAESGKFFLKAYDKRRASVQPWIKNMAHYLPVCAWLGERSKLGGRVPRMIANGAGEYKTETADNIFLLFDFIEGGVIGEKTLPRDGLEQLAQIVADLHSITAADIPLDTRGIVEDLSLPFCEHLRAVMRNMSAVPEQMRKIFTAHADVLNAVIDEVYALRDTARAGATHVALCNTDIHNWNLMCDTHVVMLDWEGICLAPAEADLFIFPYFGDASAFMEAYMRLRPGFAPNRELMRFYTFRRDIEDIWGFTNQLIGDSPDAEAECATYTFLEKTVHATAARFAEYRRLRNDE